MRLPISFTALAVIVTLLIIAVDYQYKLGIAAFLSDFFIVFIVVAILFGVLGIKMRA